MSLALQLEPHRKLVSAKKLAPLFFLFLLIIGNAIWASMFRLHFSGFELIFCFVIVLLTVSFTYGKFRNNGHLPEISYYVALWGLFTAVSGPLTYLAASLNLPLYDAEFSAADRFLGFDWLSCYNFFERHKIITVVAMVAYYSFVPQILFSIVFFSYIRKYGRNEEFFWAASISIVITGVVSGIFPAAGTLYHFRTGLAQAVHLHDFFALRNGDISEFLLGRMEGIVTFPSYHTVVAILLIYVYRGTRIFPPMLSLNVLMLLSTPVFGGHYLVDMLGGGVVALLSIFAANRVIACLNEYAAPDSSAIESEIQTSGCLTAEE